jgi:HK97 family phage portal protein
MMGFFSKTKKPEERAVTQSASNFFEVMGVTQSAAGQVVTTSSALGVPSVFAAVNFISGTIAGLPLHVFKRSKDGRDRVNGGIADLLHGAVNDETTSFEWRKYTFDQVLTGGRGLTQILRNNRGEVIDLIPMQPSRVTVKRKDGLRFYEYKLEGGRPIRLNASDVIDIPFMLAEDRLSHRGPIATNKSAIGLAQAVQDYSTRFFDNGGIPPFAITGNFQSGKATTRASDDLHEAVKKAAYEGRQALALPLGVEIKSIGSDPEKNQLLETQRFCVEQIARIYSLPPTFLQDLTNGTYSNTEQQDLHFAKHTLKKWVEQFEQEMNLKLFGRNSDMFVEFSMDGLLRGDFKTRMEGYAQAIQNGVMVPNEARALENRPDDPSGNKLMIQGATVPIENQLKGEENEV